MTEAVYVHWDDVLAAVNFKGEWRFFCDIEVMFLLDYSSYEKNYQPSPGEFRYGTMVVDESNAEAWMTSLSTELMRNQLSRTYWESTTEQVQPTFVIDFDKKLWVGNHWKMDQSPLTDYQPHGWTALEDDVMKYLPAELVKYFE